MTMTMVDVGIMGMLVDHRRVDVPMRVRLGGVDPGLVIVLVVLVVAMRMAVGQGLVGVLVLVALAQV